MYDNTNHLHSGLQRFPEHSAFLIFRLFHIFRTFYLPDEEQPQRQWRLAVMAVSLAIRTQQRTKKTTTKTIYSKLLVILLLLNMRVVSRVSLKCNQCSATSKWCTHFSSPCIFYNQFLIYLSKCFALHFYVYSLLDKANLGSVKRTNQ